jgi:hypothetical protein
MKYATEKDVVGFLKKLKQELILQMPAGGGGGGGSGSGDMLKSVYDQNNNGIVDNSERLGGKTEGQLNVDKVDGYDASAFAQASHTHTKSQITDFSHKSTHSTGGNDSLSPSDIGAAAASHTHTKSQITDFAHSHTKSDITDFAHTHSESDISISDVTTGNVSTAKHGFCPKAPNDTTQFLRGDGTWAVPPAGGSSGVSYMFPPKLISNVYFCPFDFTAVTTQALTANRIYVAPFILGRNLTITTIAIQVTSAGSSGTLAQVGIYSNGSDNAPASILYNTSDLDTASTGVKTYPNQSWQLQAGTVYWLAVQGSGAPTLRAITQAMGLVYLSGTTGTFTGCYYYAAASYGLPNSLESVTWAYQSNFPAAFFGY